MEFSNVGHGKSWKSHGILQLQRCMNPVLKQTLIADIMGDLTDRMRDFTGVINWRIHRWW